MIANQILNADDESPSISDAPSRLTWCRHSPMSIAHRGCATWRRPGIHTPDGGYGFRARSFHSRPAMTSKNEKLYRDNSLSGSLELSFNRSSTIDERTCATLWCGISTLLTISDRLLRSRNTAFNR